MIFLQDDKRESLPGQMGQKRPQQPQGCGYSSNTSSAGSRDGGAWGAEKWKVLRLDGFVDVMLLMEEIPLFTRFHPIDMVNILVIWLTT